MRKINGSKLKTALYIAVTTVLLVILIIINVTEIKKVQSSSQTEPDNDFGRITYFRDFSMETFDGKTFGAEDLKNYKVIVFNAWGPYCNSCLAEMPSLNEIAEEYASKELLIVGIEAEAYIYPEDIELARQKAADTGVTYPLLLADEAFHSEMYPLLNNALPGTWIVRNDGTVLDFVASSHPKEYWTELFEKYL